MNKKNQVTDLKELESEHENLSKLLGLSIGNLPISNKLMFVEGGFENGMDKIIYGALARKHAPSVRICPIGMVRNVQTLHALSVELKRNFVGTDFSMIRDRDTLSQKTIDKLEANGLKCTTKRHIENYLLESDILHTIATQTFKIKIDQNQIKDEIKSLAKNVIGFTLHKNANSYINENSLDGFAKTENTREMTVDEIILKILEQNNLNMDKIQKVFNTTPFKQWLDSEAQRLKNSINNPNDEWKDILYGKEIFKDICHFILKGKSRTDVASLYIDEVIEVGRDTDLFSEFIVHLKKLEGR